MKYLEVEGYIIENQAVEQVTFFNIGNLIEENVLFNQSLKHLMKWLYTPFCLFRDVIVRIFLLNKS